MPSTVFLLSPAHCGGKRAQALLGGQGQSPLAVRLRESGVPLGEIFSFLSGLYFRGKLSYAMTFQRALPPVEGVLVIVPGRGLVTPAATVTLDDLRAIATVGVAHDDPRFHEPLRRDAARLAGILEETDQVVLLGSIATDKYVRTLQACLDRRLHFPSDFVGRGDMSRGGLLLRYVQEHRELPCIPLEGAVRRGSRPPRLPRA